MVQKYMSFSGPMQKDSNGAWIRFEDHSKEIYRLNERISGIGGYLAKQNADKSEISRLEKHINKQNESLDWYMKYSYSHP